MDDEARTRPAPLGDLEMAELSALRARAYSSGGDIHSDRAAQARLEELERRVRGVHLGGLRMVEPADVPIHPSIAESGVDAVDAPSAGVSAGQSNARRRRGHRPPWHSDTLVGLAGAATALAVLAGGSALSTPHPDADSVTSASEDLTSQRAVLLKTLAATSGDPDAIDRIDTDRLRPYGVVYGWRLWAASTTDAEECLLVSDGKSRSYATCTSPASFADRGVSVAISATLITPAVWQLRALPNDAVRFTRQADEGLDVSVLRPSG